MEAQKGYKMEDELLTIKEAAKKLRKNPETLRRWDNAGKFKAIRVSGGHRMYSLKQINKFLNPDNYEENHQKGTQNGI